MSIVLHNLLRTKEGKIVISIILGIGLSSFFRPVHTIKQYYLAPLSKIKQKVYTMPNESNSFIYKPVYTSCSKSSLLPPSNDLLWKQKILRTSSF